MRNSDSDEFVCRQRALKQDVRPLTPVTKPDIMASVDQNIAMGIVLLLTIKNYWSTDAILSHLCGSTAIFPYC